jgi:hypothetical protein
VNSLDNSILKADRIDSMRLMFNPLLVSAVLFINPSFESLTKHFIRFQGDMYNIIWKKLLFNGKKPISLEN